MKQLIVHKGRTVIVPVSLGYNVSNDTFVSEIRAGKTSGSDLIASWEVSFDTDGTDGEIVLKLDDAVTAAIQRSSGYMDIKRVTGGEPVPVFEDVIEVIFKDTATA